MIDYSRLPEHMQASTRRYIEWGIPPGRFLTAVICGDLFEACRRADDSNKRVLFDWCSFFYNEAPPDCYRSPEHYREWIKRGGFQGVAEATE